MPRADRLGDMQAEEQEGDEIEERRPGDRVLRPQHAGRDDGGDRVGRVVQAVEEIEGQRDGDQPDQDGKASAAAFMSVAKRCAIGDVTAKVLNTCSMTMPCMTLATSSKRSTTFSR